MGGQSDLRVILSLCEMHATQDLDILEGCFFMSVEYQLATHRITYADWGKPGVAANRMPSADEERIDIPVLASSQSPRRMLQEAVLEGYGSNVSGMPYHPDGEQAGAAADSLRKDFMEIAMQGLGSSLVTL